RAQNGARDARQPDQLAPELEHSRRLDTATFGGMAANEPRVKVCGLTSLGDAEMAVEQGAWALGMIFFDGSPRRCSVEEARRIATRLRRKAELCGVFVNAPWERIVAHSEELAFSMIQLHGDEAPSYCAEAARRTG